MGKGLLWRSVVVAAASIFTLGGLATAQPSFSTADGYRQPVLIGLGDSVAAGLGLPTEDGVCGRSSEAYVNQVAEGLGMEAVNLACSGATSWNGLITDQETDTGEIPSQLKQVHRSTTPAAAVVTVGANDTRWTLFLAECARSNCATEAHTRAFRSFLATGAGRREEFADELEAIRSRPDICDRVLRPAGRERCSA